MIKNAQFPKMSCLLQIAAEIMDTFRFNHLHVKPPNFALGPSVNSQCQMRRFCMEIIRLKYPYLSHELQQRAHFWPVDAFCDALSKYLIKSHNFTNSSFCDGTLYHSNRWCAVVEQSFEIRSGCKLIVVMRSPFC